MHIGKCSIEIQKGLASSEVVQDRSQQMMNMYQK